MPYFLVIIVSIMPYSSSVIIPCFTISRAKDMAARYNATREYNSDSIAILLSPILVIAVFGTKLSWSCSIAFGSSATTQTGKPIENFFLNLVGVFLPPCYTALFGTKYLMRLPDLFVETRPAALAYEFIICQFSTLDSAEVCFYCVKRKTYLRCNLSVPDILPA